MKDINEEIKRIKQLFTEERLYGNLVNDKIINEQVSILKTTIGDLLTKIGKTDLKNNLAALNVKNKLKSISTEIKGFDNTEFIKYIDDVNNGFKSDLKDALKSGFVDEKGTVLKSKSVDEAVDRIVDILMKSKYTDGIKTGTLNFDELGEKTKSIFQSIDGFEDVASKNIKNIKTKNIPQLTPESKEALKVVIKNIKQKIIKYHKDAGLEMWDNFLAYFRKSSYKSLGSFFNAYKKIMFSGLKFSPATFGIGIGKDIIRTQIICPLLDPASNYPDTTHGTDATGKLEETTISEQKMGSDDISDYFTWIPSAIKYGTIFTPIGTMDVWSVLSEFGISSQRLGLFNIEGYGCGPLPMTKTELFIDTLFLTDEEKSEMKENVKKGYDEGLNMVKGLKNSTSETFTTTDGKKLTLQQLLDAAN